MLSDALVGIVFTLPIPLLCWLGGFKAARKVVPGSLTVSQHIFGLALTIASFYVLFLLAAYAVSPDQSSGSLRSGAVVFRAITFIFPVIGIAIGARGLAQLLLTKTKIS